LDIYCRKASSFISTNKINLLKKNSILFILYALAGITHGAVVSPSHFVAPDGNRKQEEENQNKSQHLPRDGTCEAHQNPNKKHDFRFNYYNLLFPLFASS
jgi:hypothetical protein